MASTSESWDATTTFDADVGGELTIEMPRGADVRITAGGGMAVFYRFLNRQKLGGYRYKKTSIYVIDSYVT